ncbi:MAG: hypothetical protein Q8P95_04125 [bacterium]|nr:hypothetical protein [bacterium]
MDGLSKMGEGARYFIQLTLHANGYDLNNLGLEQLSALYPEQLARREAVRTILRNHIPKVPAYLQDAFAAACTAPRAEQAGHLNPNGRFHQAFRGVIVMVQHERQKEAKGEQADPDLLFFNWGYDKDGNPIFDLTEGELHDLVHQLMDTLGDLNIPFGETGWFVRLNDARHRGSAMDFYRDPKGKLPPGHEFKSHYYLREKVRKEKASGPGGAAGPKDGWIEREADEQGRINVPGVGKIRFEK